MRCTKRCKMVGHGNKERVNWTLDPEAKDYLQELAGRTNLKEGRLVSKIILDHKKNIVQKLLDEKRMLAIRMNQIDNSIESIKEQAADEDDRINAIGAEVITLTE